MEKIKTEMSLEELTSELEDKNLIHLTLPIDFDRSQALHPVEEYLNFLGKIFYFEHDSSMPGDYCLDLNEVRIKDISY